MSTEASTAANFMVAAGGDLSNERQAGCCGGGSRKTGAFQALSYRGIRRHVEYEADCH
jgi:hypothetical protein